MPLIHRVRQTFAALVSQPDETCRRLVEAYLTSDQAAAFYELSSHDQAHLCRVGATLRAERQVNHDVMLAALLHDIGKISERGRVRLSDRIVKVVFGKLAPSFLCRLAARPAPRLLEGLSLAVHHPELGAERASALGCSKRTCWLIAHHEDEPPILDPELCLLVAADRETV